MPWSSQLTDVMAESAKKRNWLIFDFAWHDEKDSSKKK